MLTLGNSVLEVVPVFTYLGSLLLPNGQAKDEVNTRIGNTRIAFPQLMNSLWNRMDISLKTKVEVYQAAIRPVLYGCETWPLRVDVKKLEIFDHWCLRIISKTRWTDRVSNDAVRQLCGIPQLTQHIRKRRLQWFGHILRKPNEFVKKVLDLFLTEAGVVSGAASSKPGY